MIEDCLRAILAASDAFRMALSVSSVSFPKVAAEACKRAFSRSDLRHSSAKSMLILPPKKDASPSRADLDSQISLSFLFMRP